MGRGKRRHYSDEDVARWAELYNEGASSHEIAAMFGTYPQMVVNNLKRFGLKMRTKAEAQRLRHKASQEDAESRVDAGAVLSALREGKSWRGIASSIGLTRTSLIKVMESMGRLPDARRAIRDSAEQALDVAMKLYADGVPLKEISHETKLSPNMISSEARRLNQIRSISDAMRIHHGTAGIDRDAACSMYEDGKSTREVAEALGVSATTVQSWLKEKGVAARTTRDAMRLLRRANWSDEAWDVAKARAAFVRGCAENVAWRQAVIDDKGALCAHCGAGPSVHGGLQVDHITPFSSLMTRLGLYDCGEDEFMATLEASRGQLFDVANGRVLCQACHAKTDTYGVGALNYEPETQVKLL